MFLRLVIKNLDFRQQEVWKGMLFVEKLGEYKKVTVSLPEPNRMLIKAKVEFISRTVE